MFEKLLQSAVVHQLLVPAVRTADENGAAVAWAPKGGGSGLSFAILSVGAVSGTSPTLDVKLQTRTSSTDSTWADVPNGAFTRVTAANQKEIIQVQLPEQEVRAFLDVGGTSPSFACEVLLVTDDRDPSATQRYTREPLTP